MGLKFGLEVERFVSRDGNTAIPPPHHGHIPVDGFAAMVEFRSRPSNDLYDCWGQIEAQRRELSDRFALVDLQTVNAWKFSASDIAFIRRNPYAPAKDRVTEVRNLYGKKPRLSPNGVALASVQLNISNELSAAYTNDQGKKIPATYGLLDIPAIVAALDEEFENAIFESKRQAGMYAVKDNVRLEYRSLPTSVFNERFCYRVLSCLKLFPFA